MALNQIFRSLWRNVWFANKIRLKQLRHRVYYDLYPFHRWKEVAMDFMSKVPYALAVGSLMYVMVYTRLDITHAVGVVRRYMKNLGKEPVGRCGQCVQ